MTAKQDIIIQTAKNACLQGHTQIRAYASTRLAAELNVETINAPTEGTKQAPVEVPIQTSIVDVIRISVRKLLITSEHCRFPQSGQMTSYNID
jgi:hypothetical protein